MKSHRLTLSSCIALLVVCQWTPSTQARFVRPDLEKIPVERLAKNLEELAQKNPKDVQVRYNLARVHAMAYALKTEECEVWKDRQKDGAWFGHTPPVVPFTPKTTKDDKELKAAMEHLDKAIDVYGEVLKLQPDNLQAQLGLAWSREQKGARKEAIAGYRQVVEKGWEKDKDRKGGPLGGNYLTTEAAKYLIPLLDPKADMEEIKTLNERTAQLARLPRPVTPLAIPLRDGLTIRDVENRRARVAFDADGTGLPRKWSWITPEAGWLVYAPKEREKIDSALQMFGSVGFWLFWDHGFQALKTLDDNGDGQISGAELKDLAIWHDANGNGICDAGEVRPLSAYGIVSLSCECQQDSAHPDRIWYSPRGVTFANGKTRPTFDVVLHLADEMPSLRGRSMVDAPDGNVIMEAGRR